MTLPPTPTPRPGKDYSGCNDPSTKTQLQLAAEIRQLLQLAHERLQDLEDAITHQTAK
jgi:hypothetical protein